MTINKYRVPSKAWKKWGATARRTFNDVYSFGMDNMSVMRHPEHLAPKPAHWKTLCWNFAWIAADAVDKSLPTVIVEIDTRTGKAVCETKVRK